MVKDWRSDSQFNQNENWNFAKKMKLSQNVFQSFLLLLQFSYKHGRTSGVNIFLEDGTSIECFHCDVKSPPRSPFSPVPDFEPLCSRFNESELFVVNCTQSTFCMTRIYTLHHRQGSGAPVVITERGCAKQVYSYQSLERGQWRTVTTVMEETYTSGCVEDTEWAEHLATETKWCYCDQDLCNGYQDQDEPQPYEYQDNFIEGHGLKISSQSIDDSNFYNVSENTDAFYSSVDTLKTNFLSVIILVILCNFLVL